MKNIIAIIPARKGSKRLKNKNIMNFMGKPMLAWTIEAARKSGIFSDILVSTDSEKIAAVAKKYGASVPFLRDSKDASDTASVHRASLNALTNMEEYKSTRYDIIVQLMPNCPCRTCSDILSSYNNFKSTKSNFQISMFKFGWMNPWWAMKLNNKKNTPKPLFPEALKRRSQDLGELFCPSGAIWIAKAWLFKKEKTFYGKGYKAFPIRWQNAVDIDDKDDLAMAEVVFCMYRRRR